MTDKFFFEYMKNLLGDRYASFCEAYNGKPRYKALRVNTLKISVEDFKKIFGGELRQNPLCPESFYCDVKPSLDPLYHAGLYYMQEPSASGAVAALRPYIGSTVLDLCAAPGGKSTQVAAAMGGRGVIYCNDPEFKRTRALCENIERLGIINAVVTCNTAGDYVSAGFESCFDTLIVDAPCSGGGITRYEDVPFSADIVSGCAARQRTILSDAVKLLAGGGYMLYSTCTFSVEENEHNVEYLMSLGMKPVDIPLRRGEERGINIDEARRVYPMNFDGEGHFYCVLKKEEGERREIQPQRKKRTSVKIGALSLDACEMHYQTFLPFDVKSVNGLYPVRIGTPVLGLDKEPSHALSHALSREDAAVFGTVETGEHAADYIRGMQIDMRANRGLLIATTHGYALGYVKSAPSGDGSSVLKNKYPKYLRT